MLRSLFSRRSIKSSHKFRVPTEVLKHSSMLTAYWTVSDGRVSSPSNSPCRSNSHRGVDDRQPWSEQLGVADNLPNKIPNLEGKANMQNINRTYVGDGRLNIYAHRVVVFGNEFQEWFTNFSEPDDNDCLNFVHWSYLDRISELIYNGFLSLAGGYRCCH